MRRRTNPAAPNGFTLVELLIAIALTFALSAAIVTVSGAAQRTFQAQPEVADLHQRLRVGADDIATALLSAGAGPYAGPLRGPLSTYFAPVMPYRIGLSRDDPKSGVFYRADTITLIRVPQTSSQATIRDALSRNSTTVVLDVQPNCPLNKAACGFTDGMRAVIFDAGGMWDPITITAVQGNTLQIQHDGDLSAPYAAGAAIAQIAMDTYYLRTDPATNTPQLMHYDGSGSDLVAVDHVVTLAFEYYGEPSPPMLLPNRRLTDPVGPWTTYGPKPPPLDVDNANDEWPAGENCVVQRVADQQVPRLATLDGVALVRLTPEMLTDGPWCPDGGQADRFDADLLRIRRIRVILRVEAEQAALRGASGRLFVRGGTSNAAERYVPDQEIRFDIAPRNLNVSR